MRRGTRETSLRESNSAELFSSWPGIEVIQKYWDEYSDHKDELLIKLAGLSRLALSREASCLRVQV